MEHHPDLPVVATAHGPFTAELADRYAAVAGDVALVAISHAQRRSAPHIPMARVIHHGLNVSDFPMGAGDGGYVLFLGRMSPDKGPDRAIKIARAAHRRIIIAAKMREPAEHRYFRAHVEPWLGADAVYVGEVGGRDKLRLIADAEALINPIRWPEPFGLVMVEALACGTPVLAFTEGAAPEIIDHGTTGFLCVDEADMAGRLAHISALDRARCRAHVAKHFSTHRMIDGHLALYHQVLHAARSVPARS
jgi:glycosyltransferase involved in cell wall biosynthesis